jgi:hypothetical protein
LKIAIGINYWDDPYGLMRLIQSLPLNIIYKIYLIDGSYKGRYDSAQYKDEMTDAIRHTCDKIHYVKMYDCKQIEKRNRYFELAEHDNVDWLIVIDSDEYVIMDNPELFERYLARLKEEFPKPRCFPIANNNLGHFFPTPRLFSKPFNYRHVQQEGKISHGSLYDKDGIEIINEMYVYYEFARKSRGLDGEKACIPFIRMIHDKEFRTQERLDYDYIWYADNPER